MVNTVMKQFNPKDFIVTQDGKRGYVVRQLDVNTYLIHLASGLTVRTGDQLEIDVIMQEND